MSLLGFQSLEHPIARWLLFPSVYRLFLFIGIVSAVNFDGVLWLQVVMNNDLEEGTHFRLPEDGTVLKIESLPYSINN